jgi:hypothetical protein
MTEAFPLVAGPEVAISWNCCLGTGAGPLLATPGRVCPAVMALSGAFWPQNAEQYAHDLGSP